MIVPPKPIDPVAVARSIISDPRKKFTMSVLQIMAVCEALVETVDDPQPVISTDLAQSLAELFAAQDELFDNPSNAAEDRLEEAITAAKTHFETEFSNVAL